MISDPRKGLLILILLEKVEEEVQGKACQDCVINKFQEGTRVYFKGNVEHSCEAGITNDDKDGCVENCFPLAAHTYDKVLSF